MRANRTPCSYLIEYRFLFNFNDIFISRILWCLWGSNPTIQHAPTHLTIKMAVLSVCKQTSLHLPTNITRRKVALPWPQISSQTSVRPLCAYKGFVCFFRGIPVWAGVGIRSCCPPTYRRFLGIVFCKMQWGCFRVDAERFDFLKQINPRLGAWVDFTATRHPRFHFRLWMLRGESPFGVVIQYCCL